MRTFFLLSLAFVLIGGGNLAPAQWVPISETMGFGQALTGGTNTVFVGDPVNTYTPGRVYVFEEGNDGAWSEQSMLEADDGEIGDDFGMAMDNDDGILVVGAPSSNAAYVFRRAAPDGSWKQVAHLRSSSNTVEFGTSVEIADERVFVSSVLADSKTEGGEDAAEAQETEVGAVHVFRRASEGNWREEDVLRSASLDPAARFGASLLAFEKVLAVGAPEYESGAVVIYRRGESGWDRIQSVSARGLTEGAGFGTSLLRVADRLVVGAPGALDATGGVFVLSSAAQKWVIDRRILPFDGTSDQFFGADLARHDNDLWIGAPGLDRETGVLYRFQHDGDGWTGVDRVASPEPEEGNRFGVALGSAGSTIVAGLPGDQYGAGTVAFHSTADDVWSDAPVSPSESDPFAAVTGEKIPCSNGKVKDFSCQHVDLQSFLPVSEVGGEGGVELNDIWGWTDPKTGTEYALVGRADGTAVVDVSDPTNPVYVGELLRTEGSRVNSWRDIKVYQNHAFVVADNVGDHGMQIFDLTQLRDVRPSDMPVSFDATALYDRINSAHNVAINKESGYAYIVGGSDGGQTCGGGLHMVNVNDPLNPRFAGCFGGESSTGGGGTGGTHDVQCINYDGPDSDYRGREICVGFNATEIAIVDVTDKTKPTLISTATYPNFGYVHQGWFTNDRQYMYSNDEGDEVQGKADRTRTIVWNMTDLDNPTVANQVFLGSESSDHNLYVKGEKIYESNYKSGLRILDISDPENPTQVGHFDPFPPSSTPGFKGTWSNYPFFESGIIVTSTYEGGFFVLEASEQEL